MHRATLAFLKTEAGAAAVLALAALAGFVAANSPWRTAYEGWLHHPWTLQAGAWRETLPTLEWIKEGLMTLFFFVVGLEIKQEVATGELSSPRRLALPAAAAAGGMIAPALVYLAIAGRGQAAHGWPVPTATDIAFAVAALSIFGRRAPPALRAFLLALAVADDLGAVVLIAVLFTHGLDTSALALAGAALGFMALLGRWRGAPAALYVAGAAVLWAATLRSGVSPAVAGAAAAMTLPTAPRRPGERGAAERVCAALHPWSAYGVLPLFAFAAAGVSLTGLAPAALLGATPLAVAAGLLIGKPLGVTGGAALAVALRLAKRPDGVSWSDVAAVSLLCGVGFTMSLYLTALAFPPGGPDAAAARLAVMLASVAAAGLGGGALLLRGRRREPETNGSDANVNAG